MRYIAVAALALLYSSLAAAQEPVGTLETKMPDGRLVIVSTGPKEAASIGSYAVRVYGAANPRSPTDDFAASLVVPRDGTLSRVHVADIAGDGAKDLVVVSQSAGTGGYLAADAFRLTDDTVVHIASAHGLPPDADVVAELRRNRK